MTRRTPDRRRAFGAGRRRRGSELIEFSLVFPAFLFVFFGIIEYSWYFYQRSVVIEASRIGCQIVSQLDPETDTDTKRNTVISAVEAELRRQGAISCGELHTCVHTFIDRSDPVNVPQRVQCEVEVNFRSLSGFLGTDDLAGGAGGAMASDAWGAERGLRLIPSSMHGRSVAVFEEAD